MAIAKERIDGLIVTIQNLYLADDIPWMIGYSGGKDSTAAVQLVWMAMEKLPVEERNKPIHIMNTDTSAAVTFDQTLPGFKVGREIIRTYEDRS